MEVKSWGKTQKIKPWKEFLTKESILDLPLPKRGPNDVGFRGCLLDGDSRKVGFSEGRLRNGYPYRLECAEYDGSKIISIFVTKKGFLNVSERELDAYLRDQEIYEVYDTEPEIYDFVDQNGNDFWRIDLLLESEGDIFSSSPISIEKFSYGHIAYEFRLLLKEEELILKVYYNEDNDIVEYGICQLKKDLFKQKFDCYIIPVLEMQKLNRILAFGKSEKDLVKLLEDYFMVNDMEDFLGLIQEYDLNYSLRDEF